MQPSSRTKHPVARAATDDSSGTPHLGVTEFAAPAEAEATRGTGTHLEFLRDLHTALQPRFYLEIGVRHGNSLALVACPAVGVDPAPEIGAPLSPQVQVISETSDRFFAHRADGLLTAPVDLAFIDGMHWFEFALRDFMNIEQRSHPATVVVFDDVYPAHPLQAERERSTRVWTGDIWKIAGCLRCFRRGLLLIPFDTWPTGMLLVAGLDAQNQQLSLQYETIVEEYVNKADGGVPQDVLERRGAWSADDPRLGKLLATILQARDAQSSTAAIRSLVEELRTNDAR
jgi:hypothetical protein